MKPRSRVTCASTGPCALSERAVRKKKSLSAAPVRSGEVADGLITGMPAGPATCSTTGSEFPLELGPTRA